MLKFEIGDIVKTRKGMKGKIVGYIVEVLPNSIFNYRVIPFHSFYENNRSPTPLFCYFRDEDLEKVEK